jgi:sugar lactone lactonase YvrE
MGLNSPRPTRRDFLWSTALGLASPAFGLAQTGPRRIRTIAGTGLAGASGEGAPALEARINNPYGVIVGPDGLLYWCDLGSSRILRLDESTGLISVVAGNGTNGYSGDGGPATAAGLSTPHEVRFDRAGDLYFVERDNHTVRKVDMTSGVITTLAGTGIRGYSGDGGPAREALLAQPHSIAFDREDNLYICDIVNNRVRRIDPATGIITTFAGTGEAGPPPDAGSIRTTALRGPRSIDIAPDGRMFLILREGNTVLEIDTGTGQLRRLAGTGALAYAGDGGPAIDATFGRPGNPLNGPKGIGWAADDSLYVVDTENHVIRRIDLGSGIITTVVGTGEREDGPDGDPLACRLNRPHGVYVTGGRIYIGDSENHRIRLLE